MQKPGPLDLAKLSQSVRRSVVLHLMPPEVRKAHWEANPFDADRVRRANAKRNRKMQERLA